MARHVQVAKANFGNMEVQCSGKRLDFTFSGTGLAQLQTPRHRPSAFCFRQYIATQRLHVFSYSTEDVTILYLHYIIYCDSSAFTEIGKYDFRSCKIFGPLFHTSAQAVLIHDCPGLLLLARSASVTTLAKAARARTLLSRSVIHPVLHFPVSLPVFLLPPAFSLSVNSTLSNPSYVLMLTRPLRSTVFSLACFFPSLSKSMKRPCSWAPLLSAMPLLLARPSFGADHITVTFDLLKSRALSLSALRKFKSRAKPFSISIPSRKPMRGRKLSAIFTPAAFTLDTVAHCVP